MWIERHIFGSLDGYRTLAHTSGLTAGECKALECFAFGTPYEPAVRATFKADPAYWSRPIGGPRHAITRVTLGAPDDAGRPTLLFVTAVISDQDWNFRLQGDARPLLNVADLWRWDQSAKFEAIEAGSLAPSPWRLEGQSIQRVLGLLSLVEPAWSFGQTVVVREDSYSFDEVMAVERLLPPAIRRGFSVLYRGIRGEMPVSLNCLARSVTADSSWPCRHLVGPVSPYAKTLARQGLLEGHLPTEFIQTYNRFSLPEVETGSAYAEDDFMPTVRGSTLPRQSLRAALWTCLPIVTLLVLLALVSGAAIGWVAKPAEPNPWPDLTRKALGIPPVPGDKQIAAIQELQEIVNKEFPKAASGKDKKPDQIDGQRTMLDQVLEQATLAKAAEDALKAMKLEDQASLTKADEAVTAFGKKNPEAPNPYRTRLDQLRPLLEELERVRGQGEEFKRAASRPSLDELAAKLEAKVKEVLEKHPARGQDSQTDLLTEAQRSEIQNLLATLSTLEQIEPACVRAGLKAPRQALTDLLDRHPASKTSDEQGPKAEDWPKEIGPIVNFLKNNPDPKNTKELAEKLAKSLRDTSSSLESREDLWVLKAVFRDVAGWITKLSPPPSSAPTTSAPAGEELGALITRCTTAAEALSAARQQKKNTMKELREFNAAFEALKNLYRKRAGLE